MNINIPPYVGAVCKALESAGFRVWLVGGCVRDGLLGLAPKDYDLATAAHPEQVQKILHDFTVLPTGLKHGTVTVLSDGRSVEVTTFRVDGAYSDHRRPLSVSFTDSLYRDLSRRDFTIGAMAYHIQDGLFDPFGGAADLSAGLIRSVGNPAFRFSEDALRILRGLRFASTLGFSIETQTAAAMQDLAHLMVHLSKERITRELLLLLCGDALPSVFAAHHAVLCVILPELGTLDLSDAASRVSRLPKDPILRLAGLCLLLNAQRDSLFEDIFARLCLPAKDVKKIHLFVTLYETLESASRPGNTVCRLVCAHGFPALSEFASLFPALCPEKNTRIGSISNQMRAIKQTGCLSLRDLEITGNDLLCAGIPKGPPIGQMLDRLFLSVLQGRLPNNRQTLLDAVKKSTGGMF